MFNITTNGHGNWSDWICLRFKKDYVEYQRNIQGNNTAHVKMKIRKDDSSDEISKKIFLLDMDESTSNATSGGYVVGIFEENNITLQNKIIIIENHTGAITGDYITEDNEINDGLISKPGYCKVTSPIGSNYTIKILDRNFSVIHTISNVTIKQGKYGVDIHSPDTYLLVKMHKTLDIPLTLKNVGDFNDVVHISIDHISTCWNAELERELISLDPKEECNVNLHIVPCHYQRQEYSSADVNISITSEKDIGESDEITFHIDLLAPDLTITNIKVYDEDNNESYICGEGEAIRIKAFFKNIGNENATRASAMFYYDSIDEDHFIGSKEYDSVGKYQKYSMLYRGIF